MSWAARRRFIILLILGLVAAAFITMIGIATFYKTPTCTDGVQNQDETGIDCGGSCTYLCTADTLAPTVLFTQAFPGSEGNTNVVAEVENKNATAAAKNVPYRITLYGTDRSFIQTVTGTIDLPPLTTVPVFASNISSGKQTAGTAFLSIDGSGLRWFSLPQDPRIVPLVATPSLSGSTSSPRVSAALTNPSALPLLNIRAVALVHDETGNVIAASSTIIPTIAAQGEATATFTWSSPFPRVPALIEVVPIVSLP